MPNGATYAPNSENCYDDPANCDTYNDATSHTYASYTNTNPPPPSEFGSPSHMNTVINRRSTNGPQIRGGYANGPLPPYPDPPQPPLPPPRTNGNDSINVSSSSNNDSNISAEISEAECDREHLVNRNYGGKWLSNQLN